MSVADEPYDGEERRVTLRPGGSFDFGPATWVVGSVDGVGSYDYVGWISAAPARSGPMP